MTNIFNILIVFLINTFLFVHIEQTSKTGPKAAIQMCSLKQVVTEKNKKVGKILKRNNFEGAHFW